MKTSSFVPLTTVGQPGGSTIVDRLIRKIKAAMDLLAAGQISNLNEVDAINGVPIAGVWLITPSSAAPAGNPPAGRFYVYTDPLDGKWKSRGSNGTVTILGAP